MLKIKKDDEVVVIAGRDKGRRGEVLRVLKDGRLMVAGINMVKKHQRPNPNAGEQGGIISQYRRQTWRSGTTKTSALIELACGSKKTERKPAFSNQMVKQSKASYGEPIPKVPR